MLNEICFLATFSNDGERPISCEKIESIFEEKLREAIQPLTKQVEDAMKNINFIIERYDEIIKLLKVSEEGKLLVTENKNLKAKVLQSENEIKLLQQSVNDMDQYLRRECVEIRGLPIDRKQNSNNLVLKIAEKIRIDIKESDISVSHILPRRNFIDQSRLIDKILQKLSFCKGILKINLIEQERILKI